MDKPCYYAYPRKLIECTQGDAFCKDTTWELCMNGEARHERYKIEEKAKFAKALEIKDAIVEYLTNSASVFICEDLKNSREDIRQITEIIKRYL